MLENVTVRTTPPPGNVILSQGNGTLARTRLTVTGGWIVNPVVGQSYQIESSNRSTLNGKCSHFENGQATFNIS